MPVRRLEPPGCVVAVLVLGMVVDGLLIAAGLLWLVARLP